MQPSPSPWLIFSQLIQRYRNRGPLVLLTLALLILVAVIVPAALLPWERWLLLIAGLAMLIVCIDFNTMMWRIYRQRGDLQSVRHTLFLICSFIVLLTLGRMIGFASLFYKEVLWAASIVNLGSAAVAIVLVAKSSAVEEYVLGMPRLGDLQAADRERNEAVLQLAIREKNALEGMTVLSDDTITEANPEAYRIFGYDADKHELIGMRAHQLLHEDDTSTAYQALREQHSEPYVVRVLCKDGSIKQIEATGTTMMRHENLVRVVSFRDVTYERRYLQLLGKQVGDCLDPNEKMVQELANLQAYFHTPAAKAAKSLTIHAQ